MRWNWFGFAPYSKDVPTLNILLLSIKFYNIFMHRNLKIKKKTIVKLIIYITLNFCLVKLRPILEYYSQIWEMAVLTTPFILYVFQKRAIRVINDSKLQSRWFLSANGVQLMVCLYSIGDRYFNNICSLEISRPDSVYKTFQLVT